MTSKILVIDDILDNLISIKALITWNLKACEVITAISGREGIAMAIKELPDVIILDIHMPEMDGFETCRLIKLDPRINHLPIVMLTAQYRDIESKVRGMELGADAFLSKPIEETELIAQIKVMLRIKKAEDHIRRERDVFEDLVMQRTQQYIDSNSKLESVLNTITNPIFYKNIEGYFTGCNDAFAKMIGLPKEDIIGCSIFEIFPKDVATFSHLSDTEIINKRFSNSYDLQIKLADGLVHDLIFNKAVLLDDESEVTGVVVVVIDMTETKNRMKELQIYKKAVDSSQYLMSVIDKNYKYLFVNTLYQKYFNLEEFQIKGHFVYEIYGFERFEKFSKQFIDKALAGTMVSVNSEFKFPALGTRFINTICSPIYEQNNEISSIVIITKDITDLVSAQNALSESEDRFRRAYNKAPFPIMLYTEEGEIVAINNIWTELTGYTYNDIPTITAWRKRINAHKLFDNKELFSSLGTSDNRSNYGEYSILTANGETIIWDFSIASIGKQSDGKRLYISIAKDITERKKAELELLKAKEKAEESDKLKTAFLCNMSHEIRTPMNAILGFSQMLIKPTISEEKRVQFSQIIDNSCQQLLLVINDILEVSKLQTGQIIVKNNEVSINQIFREMEHTFQINKLNNNQLTFCYDLTDSDSVILTDAGKLKSILNNLLSNANKFTQDGNIKVGYSLKNNYLQFYVEDTGIGISAENHEKIFERFRQVEITLTRKYGGTGLGLSIAKEYVLLLGGKIWLTSDAGNGATFYFTIPYIKNIIDYELKNKNNLTPNIDWSNKTILVAEDDNINFHLLKEALTDCNATVIRAQNGLEAVKISKDNRKIDLILMDIKLPEMNGYEATKAIKEFAPHIPIFAQSAFALTDEIQNAEKYGFDSYIPKPIDIDNLLDLIGAYFMKV